MLLKLFTGPHPSDNLDTLLRHISVVRSPLCAVTPDSRSVTAFQRRLAETVGGAYLGHRVLTMEGLAAAVAAEQGTVPGIIREHMRRGLIAEIVRSRFGTHQRYGDVTEYPGFVTLFARFIEDIRSGRAPEEGLTPEQAAVLSAYASHLQRLELTDHEGMVALALDGDGPERFAARFRGPLIVHGFYDLTDAQFRLVERLIRAFPRSAVTVPYDPARPHLFHIAGRLVERFRALNGVEVPAEAAEAQSDARTVMDGFMGGRYPDTGDTGHMQIHCFRSGRAEADWVAGMIGDMLRDGKYRPDDIMIVARRQFQWGGCMERALGRHGIPLEDGVMRPLTSHPVIRFALDALDASIRQSDEAFAAVQSSVYRAPSPAGNAGGPDTGDDRAWCCMFSEVDSPEGYIQSLRRMLEWLGVQCRLDGGGDPARGAAECVALSRLNELAGEFATFHAPFHRMLRADEFLRLFRRYIEPVMIPDKPSPAGGVLLADVNHARYTVRPMVFVTGMDDAGFPARTPGWSMHAGTAGERLRQDRAAEEPLLFYMAAQGARRLFLTFPGLDDEGRDSAMSPYLREIAEAVEPWSRAHPHAAVPGAAWENGAPNSRGGYEQLMRLMKRDYHRAPQVHSAVGQVDAGQAGILARGVRLFARYAVGEGVELAGHPAFEPGIIDTGRIFSVTELEQFLECPVGYFLSRVIGLEMEEPVPGELSPADRGRLVHDILARFYRQLLSRTGHTVFGDNECSAAQELMREIVDAAFAGIRSVLTDVHPSVLTAEKAFVTRWMESFLETEAGYFEKSGFEPWAFETAFGARSGGMETADTAAPPIEIGGADRTIRIGGRIDRIDKSIRGRQEVLRVIDYKTGSINPVIGDLVDGAALQAPLYLKAAAVMMPGAAIHDGRYYNLQDLELKGYSLHGAPLAGPDWNSFIELAEQRAVGAVESIGRGSFPLLGECGRYCEFRPLCRGGRDHGNGSKA